MSIISLALIEKEIQTRTNTYRTDPPILFSGYNQEKQTVQDYEGRQLLELMQNADDAQSDCILIAFDTQDRTLSIHNNGTPFSFEGVQSLMFTGNSTKNKEEYIGNKGLGFRSILNWSNRVSIYTKDVSFRFSEAYSQNYFKNNIANSQEVQEAIVAEIAMGTLKADEIPIATLAFPEIIGNRAEQDFETSIVLDVKDDYLKAIREQIDEVNEELLLFLPHIKSLKIQIDGVEIKSFEKTEDKPDFVIINGHQWQILRSDTKLFEDGKGKKHKYKYAIAWKEDLSVAGKFYNYFPTDVESCLPCHIHATFDLNNSRKEINDTEANKYILQEVVKALGEIANDRIKKLQVDWKAYSFLTPSAILNKAVFKEFYASLHHKKEEIGVYPVVSNTYIQKESAFWHGTEFSNWVENNSFGRFFSELLKSPKEIEVYESFLKNFQSYSTADLIDKSRVISSKISDHKERAKLIKILASTNFEHLASSLNKLPLLISENFQYKEGEYEEKVFGVKELPKDFVPLDYLKVLFINNKLLEALFEVFANEIEKIQEERKEKGKHREDKVRTLEGLLRHVVDLGLDDLTQIVDFIVKGTNRELNSIENEEKKRVIVKQMVACLFSLYNNSTDRSPVKNIPLLSRDNKIVNADTLKFGDDFIPELNTETIFRDVYHNADYLSSDLLKELTKEEEGKSIINFYHWLGVNKLITIDSVRDKNCNAGLELAYFNFLFKTKNCEKHDNATEHNSTLSSFLIKEYELMQKLTFEQVILLLGKSSFICKSIALNSDDEEISKIHFKYGNAYPRPLKVPYSLIYFQIHTLIKFEQYTISEDIDLAVLCKQINFNDECYSILSPEEKNQVKNALRRLGTAESIEDVNEEYLINLLKKEDKISAKNSRKLYEKCIDFYLKSGISDFGIAKTPLRFFARKGDQPYSLVEKNEVFYSDNILLPRNFLERFALMNLPSRIGEENVKNIFGVNLIKDEIKNIKIESKQVNTAAMDLSVNINALKPYFLAYRLKTIKIVSQKNTEAKNLKEFSIRLVKELTYTFHNVKYQLKDNEFLPIEGIYYIKSNHESLNQLKQDLKFVDAIAEMVSMLFKISSLNNEFYSIFRAEKLQDVKHGISRNGLNESLDEAKALLGVSVDEQIFWDKIFPNEGIKNSIDEFEFRDKIGRLLGGNLPASWVEIDFSDFNNEIGVAFLKWLKSLVSGIELNKLLSNDGLKLWHKRQLENHLATLDHKVKQSLWLQANEGNDESKKKFISYYFEYQQAIDSECLKEFLHENRFGLELEYEKEILNFCHIKLDLKTFTESEVDVKMHHQTIFSKDENVFAPVDDMKKTLKDCAIDIYSLLYFEGDEFEEIIDLKLKELAKQFIKSSTQSNVGISDDEVYTASFNRMVTKEVNHSKNNGRTKKSGSVTENKKRESAKKGLESEHKVKVFLKQNDFDFIPISESTDSFHCDFKYKKKEESEWRFLEVKTDSGGYFFLSSKERETGMDNQYKDRYDIAVVNGNHIQFFISPFVVNEDTPFTAIPNDFIVYFEVEQQ